MSKARCCRRHKLWHPLKRLSALLRRLWPLPAEARVGKVRLRAQTAPSLVSLMPSKYVAVVRKKANAEKSVASVAAKWSPLSGAPSRGAPPAPSKSFALNAPMAGAAAAVLRDRTRLLAGSALSKPARRGPDHLSPTAVPRLPSNAPHPLSPQKPFGSERGQGSRFSMKMFGMWDFSLMSPPPVTLHPQGGECITWVSLNHAMNG